MNYRILEKCVAELAKEDADLSYVRGMLETLLAMEEKPMAHSSMAEQVSYKNPAAGPIPAGPTGETNAPMDDAAMLDAQARAAVKAIAGMNTGIE